MFRRVPLLAVLLVAALWAALAAPAHAQAAQPIPTVDLFFRAISNNQDAAELALAQIAAGWRNGYAGLIIDQAAMMQRGALGNPLGLLRYERLMQFLEAQTGQSFSNSLAQWRDWLWSLPYDPHPEYGAFKGAVPTRKWIRSDWHAWTDNIRLAVVTLMTWRMSFVLVLKGGDEVKALQGSRPSLRV